MSSLLLVLALRVAPVNVGPADVPAECWLQQWGPETRLVWDPYPEQQGVVSICIEAQTGDHYGWSEDWFRVMCVPSSALEARPQAVMRRVGFTPPVVKFRAVAVREVPDPECEGPAHYCFPIEQVSEPSNEVCGGRYLP